MPLSPSLLLLPFAARLRPSVQHLLVRWYVCLIAVFPSFYVLLSLCLVGLRPLSHSTARLCDTRLHHINIYIYILAQRAMLVGWLAVSTGWLAGRSCRLLSTPTTMEQTNPQTTYKQHFCRSFIVSHAHASACFVARRPFTSPPDFTEFSNFHSCLSVCLSLPSFHPATCALTCSRFCRALVVHTVCHSC